MKTLNKYFENLFDIDDDASILIGTEVGDCGLIKDINNKGIIIGSKENYLTLRRGSLDKIIPICKATNKPLIFESSVDILISKDVDFKGIEIQTKKSVTFDSFQGLTISNLTINSGVVKIDSPQYYTFINCNINCNAFHNLRTTHMPDVVSKKINVKSHIEYNRNTTGGVIKEIYDKCRHNEINELDINKLFNLKNVNVPYMELEGEVRIEGVLYKKKRFKFFHKSNPEFNTNKNKDDYYLDKSKQWLMFCTNYF